MNTRNKLILALLLVVLSISFATKPAYAALSVQNTRIRLTVTGGPDSNERITWDATIAVVGSIDVNPESDEIVISLRTPFSEFYSKRLPPGSLTTPDGTRFSLTDSGKMSGLETFDLNRQAPGIYTADFLDKHATLPNIDYSTLITDITIGDNSGSMSTPMTRTGNVWTNS